MARSADQGGSQTSYTDEAQMRRADIHQVYHLIGSFVRGFGPKSPTTRFDAWINQKKKLYTKQQTLLKKIREHIGYLGYCLNPIGPATKRMIQTSEDDVMDEIHEIRKYLRELKRISRPRHCDECGERLYPFDALPHPHEEILECEKCGHLN